MASVAAAAPVGTRTVTAGITISTMGVVADGIGDGGSAMIGPAGLPTGPSISTGTKTGSRQGGLRDRTGTCSPDLPTPAEEQAMVSSDLRDVGLSPPAEAVLGSRTKRLPA